MRPKNKWIAAIVGAGALLGVLMLFLLERDSSVAGSGGPRATLDAPIEDSTRVARSSIDTRTLVGESAERVDTARAAITVRVIDRASAPVPQAEILRARGESVTALARCDSAGLAQLPAPPAWGDESLIVTAEGFCPLEVSEVRQAHANELTFVLERGAELTGVLTAPDGAPAPEGVHVLAWDSRNTAGGALEARRTLRGDPRASASMTNSRGEFAIGGLDAARSYYLAAGGDGWVLPLDAGPCEPGAPSIALTLRHAVGARLEFEREDGAPVRLPDSVKSAVRWRAGSAPGLEPLLATLPGAILAGCERNLPEYAGFSLTLLFHADSALEEHATTSANVSIPGFEPRDAPFALRGLQLGMARVPVTLTATSPGFAPLRVEFHADGAPPREEFTPVGALVLTRAPGGSERYALVAGLAQQTIEVPMGALKARFVSQDGGFVHPAPEAAGLEFDLTESGASIAIPVASLGAIAFELSASTQSSGTAPIRIELSRGDPQVTQEEVVIKGRVFPAGSTMKRAGELHYLGAKGGVVTGLAPGIYSVSFPSEMPLQLASHLDRRIEVRTNEVTRVTLREK